MTTPILTEPEVRGFVGLNSDYYLSRWKPLLEGHDWSGFNWAACLISGLWLPYRKLYGAAALYYGVALFLAVLMEEAVSSGGNSGFLVVRLAAKLICGVFANQWYFRHAARTVAAARADGLADDELAHVLAKRGGTSVAAPIMFFLGFVLFTVFVCCSFKG